MGLIAKILGRERFAIVIKTTRGKDGVSYEHSISKDKKDPIVEGLGEAYIRMVIQTHMQALEADRDLKYCRTRVGGLKNRSSKNSNRYQP